MDYPAVNEFDPPTKHCTASSVGVPAMVVDAKSEREVLKMAREAIRFFLEEHGATTTRQARDVLFPSKVVSVSV